MSSTIPDNVMSDLIIAIERMGQFTPEEAKLACEGMDRIRDEIRAVHGKVNIAVPLIRIQRDEE
jgi:hypothetical protein